MTNLNSQLISFIQSANKVPGADYKEWCFFDTNCLSHLIKLWRKGNGSIVEEFTSNISILLTTANIYELHRSSRQLFDDLNKTFSKTLVCIIPSTTNYWDAEIKRYFEPTTHENNILSFCHLSDEFIQLGLNSEQLKISIQTFQETLKETYTKRVKLDIGKQFDTRDLCVCIWGIISKIAEEKYGKKIAPEDCNPATFPSFFSYYLSYYYTYIKQGAVKIEDNDFNDLHNTIAAPYCVKYYCEEKFSNMLRLRVQRCKIPTYSEIVRKVDKKEKLNRKTLEKVKHLKIDSTKYENFLSSTSFFSFSEMVNQLQEIK